MLCLLSSPPPPPSPPSLTSNAPAFVYLRSRVHSLTHLNIYKGFLVSHLGEWHQDSPSYQGILYSFLSHTSTSSSRGPYLTSAETVNDPILLLPLLNFLFSIYNHSSNSSCHHLPPGLLKQPPTGHPFSSLLSLQPVLRVLQPQRSFTNAHLRTCYYSSAYSPKCLFPAFEIRPTRLHKANKALQDPLQPQLLTLTRQPYRTVLRPPCRLISASLHKLIHLHGTLSSSSSRLAPICPSHSIPLKSPPESPPQCRLYSDICFDFTVLYTS